MTDSTLLPPTLLCHRDGAGHISALTRQPLSPQEQQAGGWVPVSVDDPGVAFFLHEVSSQMNLLNQTDTSLARVLEDLIDVLIDRGVIQFTDLPDAAKAKLLSRRQARDSLAQRLELLPDEPGSDWL
jgi:hypothetical protein